ncbi:Deoxyguanosinetriphosphate triphosphohydrolase, partial [termite gut metagenome]
ADDICYQMMDIEDAHKLKILATEETKELLLNYFDEERRKRIYRTFDIVNDVNEQIAYLRSSVIGLLINECTAVFMANEEKILSGAFEGSLITQMSGRVATAYRKCTQVAIEKIYCSREVLDVELAGFRVLSTLVNLMVDAVTSPEKVYSQLLINRVSEQYNINAVSLYERIQAALDYISGMTDVFALDLYRKINGNSLPAV